MLEVVALCRKLISTPHFRFTFVVQIFLSITNNGSSSSLWRPWPTHSTLTRPLSPSCSVLHAMPCTYLSVYTCCKYTILPKVIEESRRRSLPRVVPKLRILLYFFYNSSLFIDLCDINLEVKMSSPLTWPLIRFKIMLL